MDRRASTLAAPAPPLATPDRGLGERVRRLRNARGLTQTELAAARVSKEYISQIETGKTRPTKFVITIDSDEHHWKRIYERVAGKETMTMEIEYRRTK